MPTNARYGSVAFGLLCMKFSFTKLKFCFVIMVEEKNRKLVRDIFVYFSVQYLETVFKL